MIHIPSYTFPQRFIFDSAFYYEVLRDDLRKKPQPSPRLPNKLIAINSRASGYKRCFNAMSEKVFNSILENGKLEISWLKSMFFPINETEIEQIDDEVERTIKHAINMASEGSPIKIIIMTSDSRKNEDENNIHYNTVKVLISLKSGSECIDIINSYFNKVERTD